MRLYSRHLSIRDLVVAPLFLYFGHDWYQCGNCVASRRSIFGIRNSSQRKAGGSLGNPFLFQSFALRLEILRGPVTHVYSWPRLFGKRTWHFAFFLTCFREFCRKSSVFGAQNDIYGTEVKLTTLGPSKLIFPESLDWSVDFSCEILPGFRLTFGEDVPGHKWVKGHRCSRRLQMHIYFWWFRDVVVMQLITLVSQIRKHAL